MKFREIIRESWLNLSTGVSRAGLLAPLVSVILLCFTGIDSYAQLQLSKDAEEFRSSGAATLVLISPGAIDGPTCDALSNVNGVLSAGAIRTNTGFLALDSLPNRPLAIHQVSPGFGEVLNARGASFGLYLSEEALTLLGQPVGSMIGAEEKSSTIAGSFAWPSDGRRSDLAFAAIADTVDGELFDECWATIWPQQAELEALLRLSDSALTDEPSSLEQVNSSLGPLFDAKREFDNRPTAVFGLVGIVVAFGLGCAYVWTRRLEFATRLHFGQSRRAAVLTISLELSVAFVIGSMLALSALVLFLTIDAAGLTTELILASATLQCIAAIAASNCGVILLGTMIRERQYHSSAVRR